MNREIRTYSVLLSLPTFEERFRYLQLNGAVGDETFGIERYLNQRFYSSAEWKKVRDLVIIRDNGCDLGIAGHEIYGKILVHHLNPVRQCDIFERSNLLFDLENLICVSHDTHNAIHYGDERLFIAEPTPRCRNDTCPWKSRMKGD